MSDSEQFERQARECERLAMTASSREERNALLAEAAERWAMARQARRDQAGPPSVNGPDGPEAPADELLR